MQRLGEAHLPSMAKPSMQRHQSRHAICQIKLETAKRHATPRLLGREFRGVTRADKLAVTNARSDILLQLGNTFKPGPFPREDYESIDLTGNLVTGNLVSGSLI